MVCCCGHIGTAIGLGFLFLFTLMMVQNFISTTIQSGNDWPTTTGGNEDPLSVYTMQYKAFAELNVSFSIF